MAKTTYSILGDSPPSVDEDTLKFGAFVEPFADRLIASVDNTPFTVGIYADWGQGKTTVMQMLRTHLEKRQCVTIWFDPWKYNSREAVWKGLALTLASQVREKQTLLREYRRKRAGMKSALAELLTSRLIGDRWAEKVVKAIETEPWSPTLLHEFEKDLAKLFALVAPDGDGKAAKRPVILFVDDLDRCLPDAALGVLEALKLVLNRRGLITVIGIAEEELTRAVAAAYAKELQSLQVPYDQAWGAKYMQKIIQMPFPVPMVTDRSFDAYVLSCLRRSQVADALGKAERWCPVIRDVCGRNLREVKRFINHFISEMDKAQANAAALETTATFDPARVGFTLSLAWPRFRRFYDHIRQRVDDPELLVRYQLFFSPQSTINLEALRDPEQTFDEDRDLRRLFNLCFTAPEGETPLVVPFTGWSDFAQYLQFGARAEGARVPERKETSEQKAEEQPAEKLADVDPLLAEASSLTSAGRLEEAAALLGRAGDLARSAADYRSLCRVLLQGGGVYTAMGRSAEATHAYQSALDLARGLGDRRAQLSSLIPLAQAQHGFEHFFNARTLLHEARTIAAELEDRLAEITVVHELGQIAESEKDRARALHEYAIAARIADSIGHGPGRLAALLKLASVSGDDGNPLAAVDYFNRAAQLARSLGDHSSEVDAFLGLTAVLFQLEQIYDAWRALRSAEKIAQSVHDEALLAKVDASVKRLPDSVRGTRPPLLD